MIAAGALLSFFASVYLLVLFGVLLIAGMTVWIFVLRCCQMMKGGGDGTDG